MEQLRSIPKQELKEKIENAQSLSRFFKDLGMRMNPCRYQYVKTVAISNGWTLPNGRQRHGTRTCVIHKLTKKELVDLTKGAPSFIWCIRKLGLNERSRYYREELKKKMEEHGVPVPLCKDFRGLRVPPYAMEEILVENSPFKSSSDLKRKLVKAGKLKDQCQICGLGPAWQEKPLTLHLDHINGNNTDNRIENLRVLCPNCHNQCETSHGRRGRKCFQRCKDCGTKVDKHSERCRPCSHKIVRVKMAKKRKFEVDADELNKLVNIDKMPFIHIGKKFGVSDNSIRKRCQTLGIPVRKVHKKRKVDVSPAE